MTLILDAGPLIAFERGDRLVRAFLERALRDDVEVRTTTAVVAQTWRNPARQAALVRLLRGIDEQELTRARSRSVGVLLAESTSTDIADASVVEIARDGDEILTSDPDDIVSLAKAAGKMVMVTPL